MKKLLKLSALALFAAVSAFAITALTSNTAIAHEGEDHSEEIAQTTTAEETEREEDEDEDDDSSYRFTAQQGDSYAKIARKSVQIYGIDNEVSLSQAEIVAAETFLSSEANFPAVGAGEDVEISQAAVKAAVEKAQGLDDAAKARWQKYVPSVDFNTDHVGESRD